jgi:hypothetical protein
MKKMTKKRMKRRMKRRRTGWEQTHEATAII